MSKTATVSKDDTNGNRFLDGTDRANYAIQREKALLYLPKEVRAANVGREVLVNMQSGEYRLYSENEGVPKGFLHRNEFVCLVIVTEIGSK